MSECELRGETAVDSLGYFKYLLYGIGVTTLQESVSHFM